MQFSKGKIKLTNSKGYWTKKENWSTEDEVYEFLYGFIRATKPQLCLEVGTFQGDGTLAIAEAVVENDNHGKVFTIDEKSFFDPKVKFSKLNNTTTIIGRSPQVIDSLPFTELDFVFLDSSHSYNQVLSELIVVDKLLVKNGYIVLHDALHEKWGKEVLKAISTFLQEKTANKYQRIMLTNYNGLAILQKL